MTLKTGSDYCEKPFRCCNKDRNHGCNESDKQGNTTGKTPIIMGIRTGMTSAIIETATEIQPIMTGIIGIKGIKTERNGKTTTAAPNITGITGRTTVRTGETAINAGTTIRDPAMRTGPINPIIIGTIIERNTSSGCKPICKVKGINAKTADKSFARQTFQTSCVC